MKRLIILLAIITGCAESPTDNEQQASDGEKILVWSDEFDYDGEPDTKKWGYDLGDGCPTLCGWGNNEQQTYTKSIENVRVANGNLIIEADKMKSDSNKFTSARLITKNKGDWKYGYIEVKAKLPEGKGTWPAIWMLPTEWEYGDWPQSGEIDIMEHVGYDQGNIHGTVHTTAFNHIKGTQKGDSIIIDSASEEFHKYAINWTPDKIEFLVDDKVYNTFNNNGEGPEAWPFDKPFHLILNIAVGGNWGGKHGIDHSVWPQQMVVDYVRVYKIEDAQLADN